MEKLLKLLNQYEKERIKNLNKNQTYGFKLRYTPYIEGSLKLWTIYTQVISKPFGFVKWLVENDKIDIEKVIDTAKSFGIDTYYYEEGIDDIYIPLLMVLAVEDEPIEYLLSVIK